MYLGANQDAIGVAGDLGIPVSATMNYKANRKALGATFAACALAVDDFVSQSLSGVSASLSFSLEDREAAMAVGDDEAEPERTTDDYHQAAVSG
jgi:hypothetical protein